MTRCKILNLEKGLPFVREAISMLDAQLQLSKGNHEVILVIHGYGKRTQGGGKIKEAVRTRLKSFKSQCLIKDYVFGENFSIFSSHGLKYVPLYPELREYASGRNLGVTLIIL